MNDIFNNPIKFHKLSNKETYTIFDEVISGLNINNDKNITDGISNININYDDNKKSSMPSIEQLMKERDNLKL